MNATLRETVSSSATLLVFAVVCAAMLAAIYLATRQSIAHSEQVEKMRLVAQALPPEGFDNDPVRDARPLLPDPLLGLMHPGLAYVAAKRGTTTAVVLEDVAPDGYGGEIKMLVGVRADGSIAGVRVTSHHETPGLGDYIDIAKSNWINQFVGKRLNSPPAEDWRVRKDGGQFDYMAGATVTPRAVVKAVHNALRYFEEHKAALLSPIQHKGKTGKLGAGESTSSPGRGGQGGRNEESGS